MCLEPRATHEFLLSCHQPVFYCYCVVIPTSSSTLTPIPSRILCSPGWLGTFYIAKVELYRLILLPQSPKLESWGCLRKRFCASAWPDREKKKKKKKNTSFPGAEWGVGGSMVERFPSMCEVLGSISRADLVEEKMYNQLRKRVAKAEALPMTRSFQ